MNYYFCVSFGFELSACSFPVILSQALPFFFSQICTSWFSAKGRRILWDLQSLSLCNSLLSFQISSLLYSYKTILAFLASPNLQFSLLNARNLLGFRGGSHSLSCVLDPVFRQWARILIALTLFVSFLQKFTIPCRYCPVYGYQCCISLVQIFSQCRWWVHLMPITPPEL